MKRLILIAASTTLLLGIVPALAQSPGAEPGAGHAKTPVSQETTAEVPELTEFHEVIYQLWHDAWPKKDAAAMSTLLPKIEEGAGKIEKAALPGILRDRKAPWDANVAKLREIVSQYRAAVEKKELQPILDAGEALHRQYEMLVRVIRPALKELDAFHQSLYRLYHYDLPAYALPRIQADAKELKEKMAELEKATLPSRMASKQPLFEERRKALDAAVAELATAADAGKDEKAIKAAIETVHAKYQALDQVF
jgi:hypothetical protein